jgi:restriction system protein
VPLYAVLAIRPPGARLAVTPISTATDRAGQPVKIEGGAAIVITPSPDLIPDARKQLLGGRTSCLRPEPTSVVGPRASNDGQADLGAHMARRRRKKSSSGGMALAAAFAVIVVLALIIKVLSSPVTWLVLLPLVGGGTGAWLLVRSRRHAAAVEAHRRWLLGQSCFPAADAMSGSQFEAYVAELLRMDGHQDVRIVGGPGDGGADILSAEPSGRKIAVQCKRVTAAVPVGVVRQLNGTIAHEHPGRAGALVTTALLTRPATELAARARITVVDRNALASWMSQARAAMQQQEPAGPASSMPWPTEPVKPQTYTVGPT